MSLSGNPQTTNLEPLYNGLPVLVRLITSDDVICILFECREDSTAEPDTRLFMERPLSLFFATSEPVLRKTSIDQQPQTTYSSVRTRVDRWMPMTDAAIFPVYPDHILSIAPLSANHIDFYMNCAGQLYTEPAYSDAPDDIHMGSSNSTDTQTSQTDAVQQSYMDFLLHQFHPKGKPH